MEDPTPRVYEFKNFKSHERIVHGVFSRSGGRSTGFFDSLNVGLHTDDDTGKVQENRKQIALQFGMRPLIYLNQVHSDTIKLLKNKDNDLAAKFEPGKDIYTADGVMTDIPGIVLVIQVADCQSVMMYDPERQVVANVHSGWKSSIKNIIGQCIEKMTNEFGSDPEDIIVGISPSLGPCCSEFINYQTEIPGELWKYRIENSNYFDFWQLSRDQLVAKGILPENIENMNICTKCNDTDFFSFRKNNVTGRFACVIGLA